VFESVGVRLEPAVLVFYERESESVEYLGGAQPHKAAAAGVDVGPEGVGVAGPHQAVDAIRSNDQVGVILLRHRLVVLHIGFEHQLHTHVFAALLQNVQQLFAAYADKAVPVRAHAAALEVDVDVVPVVERVAYGLRRYRVGLAKVVHGGVGKHHAPAKRVVRAVALDDGDIVGRILQLHEQAEIQAGGPTAQADDLHCATASVTPDSGGQVPPAN